MPRQQIKGFSNKQNINDLIKIWINFWNFWPCQVKEYKIVLEQSLLTGWLAGYVDCQPRFQFPETELGRTVQQGWDFFWKMAADQCCQKITLDSEESIIWYRRHLILEDVFSTLQSGHWSSRVNVLFKKAKNSGDIFSGTFEDAFRLFGSFLRQELFLTEMERLPMPQWKSQIYQSSELSNKGWNGTH